MVATFDGPVEVEEHINLLTALAEAARGPDLNVEEAVVFVT